MTRLLYQLILGCGMLYFSACIPQDKKHDNEQEKTALGFVSTKDLSSIKVGYCTPSLDASFYVALENAIKNKVESYGMQYLSTDGQSDIAKQVIAVEDLLAKGINVLILNPLDPKALLPVIQNAKQQGIEVFIVDSYIEDDAPYTSAVFANNQLNGEILGEWLVRNSKLKEFNIAIISGNQGNPVGREKRLGFIRGISDAQLHNIGKVDFEVLSQGWGGWNNNGGLKAMEDILVAHPKINVLLAENDAMAMGALKAIREMNLQNQITILGFDAQKEALELMKSNQYAATAQNSPSILGNTVVETVVKYLNDPESIKRINYTPSVLIDPSNVGQYYNPKALF